MTVVKPLESIYLIELDECKYSVLPHFLIEFEEALQRRGIRTLRLSTKGMSTDELIDLIQKECPEERPDATFGFNLVLYPDELYNFTGIPHISWFVDSALFTNTIDLPSVISCFVDKNSCRLFQEEGRADALFLPHAIDRKNVDTLRKLSSEIEYEVLFVGSYYDETSIWTHILTLFPRSIVNAIEEAVQIVISSSTVDPVGALEYLCQNNRLLSDEIYTKFSFKNVAKCIDLLSRAVDRIGVLEALVDDFEVHVFTENKDGVLWRKRFGPKIHLHHESPYNQLHDLMLRSRFVLNSVPTYKQAVHERVLLALSAGVCCISSRSELIESIFPEGSNLLFYQYGDWSELVEKMKHEREKNRGFNQEVLHILRDRFTWDCRVDTLCQEIPKRLEAFRKLSYDA